MLTWIREKFGTVLIGGIIGFIAFVFVFFGVFNPKTTRGLGEGSVAGEVNGEPISISDFNRELARRTEFFKSMMGGKVSESQLKAFHLREGVFNELVNKKLTAQAADKTGMEASDEEIRDKIREIPAFQKDGKFDLLAYKQVLQANNYTQGGFERLIREDLNSQQWTAYFHSRVKVSEQELKQEYLVSRDKRDVKYVVFTPESGRKDVKVEPAEIQKFLADPGKLNIAKSQYEGRKTTEFKGKTFDEVKDEITHEILAGEKGDQVHKANERLANQVAAIMTADKASDVKVNALVKPYGLEVKQSGSVPRNNLFIPGAGEMPSLVADAFSKKSSIDPAQGGKPKIYPTASGFLVAVVSTAEKPDLAKFDAEKDGLRQTILSRKEREVYEAWVKSLNSKASIDRNDSVIGEEDDSPQSHGKKKS